MTDWLQRQAALATTLDTAAWGVGLFALAIYLLPYLATACGLTRISHRAINDPRLAEPSGTDDDYDGKAAELAALGFAPAGVIRERVWLHMSNLRKTFTPRFHRSGDGRTLAALYRLAPGGLVRVAFSTATPAGRLVRTAMPGVGEPKREADHWRAERPWQPLADLLGEHHAHAAEAGGATPVTLADHAARDERITRRELAAIGTGGTQLLLVVGWLVPFLAAVGLFALLTHQPAVRLASLGFVAAGACYPLLAFWLMDWLMNATEQCEAATADGATTGHLTANGVGVQEVAENGVYVLTLICPVEEADELPARLADVRDALTDWQGKRPDAPVLLTVVARRPLWDAAEAAVDDGPEVRVGILDGSDAPAREFVLGGAVGVAG